MKLACTLLLSSLFAVSLAAQADSIMVTFAVDMTDVDTFMPATDRLVVAGDFQGWMTDTGDDSNVLTDPDSNGVYSLTRKIALAENAAANTITFKFVINGFGNNEFTDGVDAGDCTVTDDGGNINREEVLSAEEMNMLPIYVYSSCDVSEKVISSARDLGELRGVSVGPNPMRERAVVALPALANERFTVRVLGMDGRVISEQRDVTGARFDITRGAMASGMYLVEVTATDAGERAVLRLTVE